MLAVVPVIYVVVEPDLGDVQTLNWISKSRITPRVRVIQLQVETKDPNELYLADSDNFRAAFQRAMETAEPFSAPHDATDSSAAKAPASGICQIVNEFNLCYAVVNESGKAVIYERARDPILKRDIIIHLQFEDLKKLYMNRRVLVPRGKDKTAIKPVAEVWLEHPDRRTYVDGVVFDPTGRAPATCWNLWSGFAVEPKPRDWSKLKDYVRNVICAGNDDHFQCIIGWSARMFQHPDEPGEIALIFRGLKGAGRGIFLSAFTLAWGAHGIHIRDAKHLVGNFNAHLRDCVCLFADEAFFAGDRQHEAR